MKTPRRPLLTAQILRVLDGTDRHRLLKAFFSDRPLIFSGNL